MLLAAPSNNGLKYPARWIRMLQVFDSFCQPPQLQPSPAMEVRKMKRSLFSIVFAVFLVAAITGSSRSAQANPRVLLKTNMGEITLELFPDKAPLTVKNFLHYVNSGHYNGTIFHRVINGFMIQGGGFGKDMKKKGQTLAPIKNEAGNGLKNDRGTIAMARTSVVDSATDQFFINVADNHFLNHKNNSPQGYGYAVFGRVIKGMEVVDKIKAVKTTTVGYYRDVPASPVIIESASEIK